MTNHEILKASLLDIIFDNRNKQYGAYALRKTYNQRMMYALTAAIGCTIALLAAGLYFGKKEAVIQPVFITSSPVELIDYVAPEKEQPQPKAAPAAPQPPVATRAFTSDIEIVKDIVPVENALPPQEDLINVAIGTKNMQGDVPATVQQSSITENAPAAPAAADADDKVYEPTGVDEAAEFPGGQGAFQRFLAKHLQTPEALEPGQRKTVHVRFVIQKDGAVLDGAVLRSGGAAFDAEVLRVLRKMPRWRPATQAGRQVGMAYVLPVTFAGSEQ